MCDRIASAFHLLTHRRSAEQVATHDSTYAPTAVFDYVPDAQKGAEPTGLDACIMRSSPQWPQLASRLRFHVELLASTIGGRLATTGQEKAAKYIEQELGSYGYSPQRQAFVVAGQTFANIEAEIPGVQDRKKILVIGAHYDTAGDLPGANDNASGVAATLELARHFVKAKPAKTVRWLFFANEEPPYFQTPAMGSYVYANRCRKRNEDVFAMLSLETIGFYTDEPGSQKYPFGFHFGYPDRGNFLGFVADFRSAFLLRTALKAFRAGTSLPAEGVTAPATVPGIAWSDHWSFWHFGYRALMLTDTAPFRYPYYHSAQDTPDKLDYRRFSEAVIGIRAVVQELARSRK
jgi:Zn-dependent M28 family amino/carboxypeptidase